MIWGMPRAVWRVDACEIHWPPCGRSSLRIGRGQARDQLIWLACGLPCVRSPRP